MYHTEMTCEYHSDETYQSELLKIFCVDHYELLVDKIFQLYSSLEKTQELNELLNLVIKKCAPWATDETAFFVLFSYDYFQYTHQYLIDVLTNRKTNAYLQLKNNIIVYES
jgi:hypothetical protein